MYQDSERVESLCNRSYVILPRAGTMRNGIVFRQTQLVPHIDGKGSSLLPTLQSARTTVTPQFSRTDKANRKLSTRLAVLEAGGCIDTAEESWKREQANLRRGMGGGGLNPDYLDWYMGFPIGWSDVRL